MTFDFYEDVYEIRPSKILDAQIELSLDFMQFLNKIWSSYGNLNDYELIELIHVDGSPWYELVKEFDFNVPENTFLNKNNLKEFFKTQLKKHHE